MAGIGRGEKSQRGVGEVLQLDELASAGGGVVHQLIDDHRSLGGLGVAGARRGHQEGGEVEQAAIHAGAAETHARNRSLVIRPVPVAGRIAVAIIVAQIHMATGIIQLERCVGR